MASRIVIVDDDRRIREMLARSLGADGYTVESADSGEAGLALIRSISPDAVILDVGLPGMDGFEACRRIRREGHDTAVLLLTARGEIVDRVAGLEYGADDYLAKPFAYEELLARLRAIMRRTRSETHDDAVRFGDLVVRPAERAALRNGQLLELTAREFDLLELFIRNPRTVIDRGTIIERVWHDGIDIESNALDVCMGGVRKKLEAGDMPRLIHTVRGIGYVLREPGS